MQCPWISISKQLLIVYTMLKCVSLLNQCDIIHSGIVCDITPLPNFFLDITPVKSKAYVAHSTLSRGVFMHGRCQLIKTLV